MKRFFFKIKLFFLNFEWKDFISKTLSSIIAGLVIAIVGLKVWQKQNFTTQQQKLYENKIEILKRFAADGSKMVYYSEFMIRTKLELYQMLQKGYGDTFPKSPDPILYEKTITNQLILQKENPILYTQYMKGLEFQSDFTATLLLTRAIFDPYSELDSLQRLFSEEVITEKIKIDSVKWIPIFEATDKEMLIHNIRNEQIRLFTLILESLYLQIKYPENIKKNSE